MRLHTLVLTLATAALSGVLAFAEVTPTQGTIGSEFTATFDQDVGNKPKLVLSYEGGLGAKDPKAKVKVLSSDGTNVTFQVKAVKGHGTFGVGIKKSDADGGTLALVPPGIDGFDTDTVAAGGTLQIFGGFFGELTNRRAAPKVYVGGKKAKVKEFTNDALTVLLHKKTPAGQSDVRVVNKLGETTSPGAVLVTAPPKPIKGKNQIAARIAGKKFKKKESKKAPAAARGVYSPGLNVIDIIGGGGGVAFAKAIKIPNFKTTVETLTIRVALGTPIENATFPRTFALAEIPDTSYRKDVTTNSGSTSDIYRLRAGGGGTFTVTIDAYNGSRISGSFSGTMVREAGDGPATIDVEKGSFVVDLQ